VSFRREVFGVEFDDSSHDVTALFSGEVDEDLDGVVILGFSFNLSIDDVFSSRFRSYVCLDDFVLVVEG
jgi:hypothetical protein